MRKLTNIFGIALLALASIAISSCSDDNDTSGPKSIKGEQNFLMKIDSPAPVDSLFEDNESFRARLQAAGFTEDKTIAISGKDSVDIQSQLDAIMEQFTKNLESKDDLPFTISVYRINKDDENKDEKAVSYCWYEKNFQKGLNAPSYGIHACEFQYEEKTLYATDIAVVNRNRGGLRSMPSGYSEADVDLNRHAGGDDVYMGIKYEKYDESHKNQYITDVICLASNKSLDNNYTLKYNGRTYQMARGGELDLNAKAGGDWVYIMFTRDEFKVVDGQLKARPAYLVNTAEDGYVMQYYVRDWKPTEITNTTRLVYSYSAGSSSNFDLAKQNIGQYDRHVRMIDASGNDLGDADFNRRAGGEFIKMVCAYDYAPMVDLANWMSQLKGDTYLSDVTIPGTHDSFTWNTSVNNQAKDQQLNISEQWEAGVRAFDLRIRHDYSLGHGNASCNKTMHEAYREINNQLKAHDGEFAIVFNSYERLNVLEPGMPKDWRDVVRQNEIEIFKEENIVAFHPNLTVDDVKGKIVLIHQDPYPHDQYVYEEKLGSCTGSWKSYPQFTPIWSAIPGPAVRQYFEAFVIQNNYHPDNGYSEKIEDFKELANAFFDFPSAETWAINELSGYTTCFPEILNSAEFAENVNKETYPFIKANMGKKFGIVLGDYMGVNNCKQEYWVAGINVRPRGRAVAKALVECNERFFKPKNTNNTNN